tara:strand:- start:1903 stop:2535 length:633 start_codon:yes stop_codon:yes gene_type:complete
MFRTTLQFHLNLTRRAFSNVAASASTKQSQLLNLAKETHIPISIPVSDDFGDEASYSRLAGNIAAKRYWSWTPGRFTILYDGKCPLCAKEIKHYKNLAKSNEIDIVFLNLFDYTQLTTIGSLLERHDIKLEDARKRMHIITEHEKVVRNAEAFVEIWRRMPYWRMIVPFVDNRVGIKVGNKLYDFWATQRWQNREEMDSDKKCSTKNESP